MIATFKRFLNNDDGATAIEYGLIAGLISVVIITAATTLGTTIEGVFTTISDAINNAGI